MTRRGQRLPPIMTNEFFTHPILNSPYEIPAHHWELDPSGQPTREIIESRGLIIKTNNATSALAIYLEEQALHTGMRMQIRIRAEGFDGVIRMVAHGAGIAVVPKAAIERRPHQPSYHYVPLQEAWAHRALLLCARNFERLPAYAKALARHLAE